MFIDFAEIRPESALEADLCIIGAGAAGITLATEFIGHACKVLLIESGTDSREAETTDLYRAEMAPNGKLHHGIHEGRARVFGGTTTLWGGQARPLERMDFEPRSWVADSGWPFSRDELVPYHERAGTILGLRDVAFEQDIHKAFGILRPAIDPAVAAHVYSRWSPRPNFAVAYRQQLAAAGNIHVLRRANVTEIVPSRDGSRVERVELRDLSGLRRVASAKTYVICCGGIETPRLLLASNRVQPAGVGNLHDLVGRYFQDHLAIRWATFVPTDPAVVNGWFNSFFRGKTKYTPLLSASEAFQRRHETLNISAAVIQDELPSDSAIESAKRLFRVVRGCRFDELVMGDGAKVLRHAPEILRSAYRIAFQRRSYVDPKTPLFLGSTLEQEPSSNSRVFLGAEVDAIGMRRPVLDWRLTPLVGKTLEAFAGALKKEFRRIGLGEVRLYPWLRAGGDHYVERIRDVFHHIGTTRMHEDPRQGVVNADCRVHGLNNLYVAGSSVFPTGGHSNPTFTILLLSLRLADRLKRSFEAGINDV